MKAWLKEEIVERTLDDDRLRHILLEVLDGDLVDSDLYLAMFDLMFEVEQEIKIQDEEEKRAI